MRAGVRQAVRPCAPAAARAIPAGRATCAPEIAAIAVPPSPVLLIGAAGLLGAAVGARLTAAGVPVRALVRDVDAAARLPYRPHEVVVADLARGVSAEALGEARTVVYLAATSVPADSPRDPAGEFRDTLPVLNGVLARLSEVAGSQGRFIFPSSGGGVYGERDSPADESAPAQPSTAYALGKILGEEVVRFWSRTAGIGFDILRITNVYGSPLPRSRPQGVIDVWLDDALAGRTSRVWGSLAVERDFLFVDDAADAVARVAANASATDAVYNVAYGDTHSLADVLSETSRVTGGRHRWAAEGGHEAGVARSAVDAGALRRDFGWAPRWSLAEGVQETWRRKTAMQAESGASPRQGKAR